MAEESAPKLREIALQLVKEIGNEKRDSQEGGRVPSDELLSALHVVFPQTLQHALDLVDRRCITKVVSTSGRELFQIVYHLKDEVTPVRWLDGNGSQTRSSEMRQLFAFYITRNKIPNFRSEDENNQRQIEVKGSSGKIYNCLMSSEFCTCPSFTYYVLMKEEILMCKHVLAVYIAQNLENVNERNLSDEEFAKIFTD